MRKSWSDFFMEIAWLISTRSKDESTQVGAVITKNKKIISVGYNGFAPKVLDKPERILDRPIKLKLTIHAEVNAILTANTNLIGCTLYCTHIPCTQCASIIIQSGITRVIYETPSFCFAERWKEDIILTKQIFTEADITFMEHTNHEDN